MTISIIGANSLLASYCIEAFIAEGYFLNLYAGSNPLQESDYKDYRFYQFRYPEHNISFEELLSSDLIIYCAATGVQANQKVDSSLIYDVNAFLPLRIVNYLEENNFTGNWVSFGSYFEIGNNNENKAYTEEEVITSLLPVPNHYCSSKRLLTRFISNSSFKSKIWHLVLPTIYGARENSQRLIPYIVSSLKAGATDLKLSSGQQVRQYIHCKDVASLVTHLIEHCDAQAGIYNVTAGKAIKIADLVTTIFDSFGKDATKYLGTLATRDESMKVLMLHSGKTEQVIQGWMPAITLAEGIKEYL